MIRVIVNYFVFSFIPLYDTFYLLYKEFLIKTPYIEHAEKNTRLHHIHLEGNEIIKINILRGLAYVKFNLDNG